MGFDDTVVSQVVTPKLTTVRMPLNKAGVLAAQLLMDDSVSQTEKGNGCFTLRNCDSESSLS